MSVICRLLPEIVEKSLPVQIVDEIRRCELKASEINEIRLRINCRSSVTANGANLVLRSTVTREDMTNCMTSLCGGSVYAHSETIREGYIVAGEGIRVGVCGYDSGGDIRDISSLNIRIPHMIRQVCQPIISKLLEGGRLHSALIYSPPGIGKTTVLRDIASKLGGEYRIRVALIDTRGELFIREMFSDSICDVMTGYGRAAGIEIATRTMSSQVLICDELGDPEEAKAILSAQNTGVPLIASAHASDIRELMLRPNIRMLCDNSVFDLFVGLSREVFEGRLSRAFRFDFLTYEEMKKKL